MSEQLAVILLCLYERFSIIYKQQFLTSSLRFILLMEVHLHNYVKIFHRNM